MLRSYQGGLRYQEMLGITLLIVVLVILLEALCAVTRNALLGTTERLPKNLKTKSIFASFVSPGQKIADLIINRSGRKKTQGEQSTESRLTAPWTVERIKVNTVSTIFSVLLVLSFIIPDIGAKEILTDSGNIPEML